MPGSTELMIILAITLFLFGPNKLPQLGKAIGETIRNFRKGISQEEKTNMQIEKNDDKC
tara:strand:- start:451 stop:627 length:177 start_codon:yes stop_codon:yes gene_type:complete